MITAESQRQMREGLKEKVGDGLTHINRSEVEELGSQIQLSPEEAARLFQDLKGVVWQGDYITSDERGWIAAWIERTY